MSRSVSKYVVVGLHALCWVSMMLGSFLVSMKGVELETTTAGFSLLLSAALSAALAFEIARKKPAHSKTSALANLIDLVANRPMANRPIR